MRWRNLLLCAVLLLAASGGLFAQAPPTPQHLTAELLPTMGPLPVVKLAWEMPMVTTSQRLFFRIDRSVDDSAHFEPFDVTDMMTYFDHHVGSGHTYYYTVSAVAFMGDTANVSAPSNIAWVTIGPPTPSPYGIVHGTITDSVSGKPIPLVRVIFFRKWMGWVSVRQTWTDLNGRYSAALDTGTYLIKAQPTFWLGWNMFPISLYLPEWFDDAPDMAHATPVPVGDGSSFTADFDLNRIPPPVPATVSGTVTDSSGNPLAKSLVVFTRPLSELPQIQAAGLEFPGQDVANLDLDDVGRICGVLRTAVTDSLGHYSIDLIAGQSYMAMAAKRGYLPQFYKLQSDPRDADIIHLTGDTTGIDFALIPRPSILNTVSGTVRDSMGTGVASRILLLPLRHPRFVRFGSTDSVGAFKISNVVAGSYFVLALPLSGYAPAFYKAGAYGVMQWQEADTVHVSGAVAGIDIGVVPIGSSGVATLSGTVQSQGEAVAGVTVLATDEAGNVAGYAITDASGAYSITGVPAGQITVLADREGYSAGQASVTVGPSDFSASANFTLDPMPLTSVGGGVAGVPLQFALDQNYPNPFNPSTRIAFSIPSMSTVHLTVYNVLGQEVATLINNVLPAGQYQAVWAGKDNAGRSVSSGVYFYRLDAVGANGGLSSTRKLVLLK